MKAAATHYGRHIPEYVNSVIKQIDDIMKLHKAKKITDDIARKRIAKLQDELREGLEAGTIALTKEEADILKNGGILAIGPFMLASPETVSAVKAECARVSFSELIAPGTASHYTGEDGAMGWLGWVIDLFNPVDDVKTVGELYDALGTPSDYEPRAYTF